VERNNIVRAVINVS